FARIVDAYSVGEETTRSWKIVDRLHGDDCARRHFGRVEQQGVLIGRVDDDKWNAQAWRRWRIVVDQVVVRQLVFEERDVVNRVVERQFDGCGRIKLSGCFEDPCAGLQVLDHRVQVDVRRAVGVGQLESQVGIQPAGKRYDR